MKKVFLINWCGTNEYYTGKGFYPINQYNIFKEYKTEKAAYNDLVKITEIYFDKYICLKTVFINDTTSNTPIIQ